MSPGSEGVVPLSLLTPSGRKAVGITSFPVTYFHWAQLHPQSFQVSFQAFYWGFKLPKAQLTANALTLVPITCFKANPMAVEREKLYTQMPYPSPNLP